MSISVLEQAALAFRKGNRGAAWISVPWGASIPVATHVNAHAIDAAQPLAQQGWTYLAAGGLVYSGLTVFGWMRSTLIVGCESRWERAGATAKALGFVVLSEGTLVHAPKPWLSYAMLGLLVVANAIAMQANMVLAKADNRKARKRRKTESSGVFRRAA